MASINGGNGKYLYQFTGGQILQEGERYNIDFFKNNQNNNFNRSNSLQNLPKFNHQNIIQSQNNITTDIGALNRNNSYVMLGRQVSSVRNNNAPEYQSTISQSVSNLLQRKNTNGIDHTNHQSNTNLDSPYFSNTLLQNNKNHQNQQQQQQLYLLSPIDQKVVPVENIFKKQKAFLRQNSNMYSSHRNYLESLAKEKTISFSKADLERIQEKARNLHWLSSHEENPGALRPKQFYIKELPKRTDSQEHEIDTASTAKRHQRVQSTSNHNDSQRNYVHQNHSHNQQYKQHDISRLSGVNGRLYDSNIINEMINNQSIRSQKAKLRDFKYNYSIIEKNIFYQQQQQQLQLQQQQTSQNINNILNRSSSAGAHTPNQQQNPQAAPSKQSILEYIQRQQLDKPNKNAMKDYLIKVKCIDPEQLKVIRRKIKTKNNQSIKDRARSGSHDESQDIFINDENERVSSKPRIERVVSMPALKVNNREGIILKKVRDNIDRINREQGTYESGSGALSDAQSISTNFMGRRHQGGGTATTGSILQNTINETQGILKDAIDESKQKKEKDLERKNFLMNVITNNQLVDKKNIELDQSRTKQKSMQNEMKQIYEGYSIEALTEVQKIKNDMLLQAFKKKMEKELISNINQNAVGGSSTFASKVMANALIGSLSNNNIGDHSQLNDSKVNGGQSNYFMFEDTPSNINLVKRANKRQESLENSLEIQKETNLNGVQGKRQFHILNDEHQGDVQLEQVGAYNRLNNQYLNVLNNSKNTNKSSNSIFAGGNASGAQANFRQSKLIMREDEKYALSVNIPPSTDQSLSLLSPQLQGQQPTYLRENSTFVNSRQPKTQQQKIQDFLADTHNKIERLKRENFEMQIMSNVQMNGDEKYKEQQSEHQHRTKEVFELVKNNQSQDLHKFFRQHGKDYAVVIDKLGETPLHWAVKRGFSECVEILLNNGADPNHEDFFQRSPALLLEKSRMPEIEKMLKLYNQGKYEPTHAKFDARELILKEPAKKKKQQDQNNTTTTAITGQNNNNSSLINTKRNLSVIHIQL